MSEERTNVSVQRLVRLRTTCGAELWAGFFGINENGDQPECHCEITEDVEVESLERNEDGTVRPCYAVKCPECGSLLEWPHEWEIIETNDQSEAVVRTANEIKGGDPPCRPRLASPMDIQRLRNLTTGRLHTEIGHFYEDLDTITGESGLMTHMLPRALRAVEPWLHEHVTDPRFWNGEHDPSHVGEIELPEPTAEDRAAMFERYKEMPNPLAGKQVIVVQG